MKKIVFIIILLQYNISLLAQLSNLKCEYLVAPIGIDTKKPRLMWTDEGCGKESGIKYRIRVSTDSLSLTKNTNILWESESNDANPLLVKYNGEALKSFTRYWWNVTSIDNNGEKNLSSVSSFETAMLDSNDWIGSWITDNKDIEYPIASQFRKQIKVTKQIITARAYISAGGFFEFFINGEKIGNHMLDPMFTNYEKRCLYVTFDITKQIKQGDNILGIILGNGWYNHQPTTEWNFKNAPWRARPRFLANIHISYSDGTKDIIFTDKSWKFSDSPIVSNNIYTAEQYDANKESKDWNSITFDDTNWTPSIETVAPSDKLMSQQLHPIQVTDILRPTLLTNMGDTCYRFKFNRNIAGIIDLKVKGSKGTVLKIKHSELLYDDGSLNLSNLDYFYTADDNHPFQTDIVTLSGNEDHFSPKFNYKGFQYVEVLSSKPIKISEDNISALQMHSNVPSAGNINSSNAIINKIHQACRHSYLSNLHGYPTDCPQREKNGWTGDAHIAIQLALYNFDVITIYEKWMQDFKDIQRHDGVLPAIIPAMQCCADWEFGNGIDWTSAIAIIPWEIYQFYGDTHILDIMYENIKLYVDYIDKQSPNGLTTWGLGDWLAIKTQSDTEFTSSLYYYTDALILSKMASVLEKEIDHILYSQLADKIRIAINNKFFNAEKGIYCNGSQTELASALYWDIVPNIYKKRVAENLLAKVKETDYHIDTGLLGSKVILGALTNNGFAQAAYEMASKTTYPSWGYWMVNGSTTIYEGWDVSEPDTKYSLNHIMLGEIGAWFYKGLGGIYADEENPGFKHFFLRPNFVEGIDSFDAEHTSPYGKIESKWTKKQNYIEYQITVPPNSTATLSFPENIKENFKETLLVCGTHYFKLSLK